jgi:hypothetical protein
MRNKLLIPFAMTSLLAFSDAALADHEVDFLPPWDSPAAHRIGKEFQKSADRDRRRNDETFAESVDQHHAPRSGYD